MQQERRCGRAARRSHWAKIAHGVVTLQVDALAESLTKIITSIVRPRKRSIGEDSRLQRKRERTAEISFDSASGVNGVTVVS